MKNIFKIPGLYCGPAVMVGVAMVLLLTGCRDRSAKPMAESSPLPVMPVQVVKAKVNTQANIEEVVGTVKARLQSTLEARISGRIENFPVVAGQRLKAGDLVARLDVAELSARLEATEAALEQAEHDGSRIAGLFQQQAATRADLDSAQSMQRRAKAAVAEARAMTNQLAVLAPFDGVVTRKFADLGDMAVPGKPLLSIENPASFQMDVDVPQTLVSKIQAGAQLAMSIDGVQGQVMGTVSEIGPALDTISRTLKIKLDLPETAGLSSGQFGRLQIKNGEASSLRVPVSALVQRGQLEIVFVVVDRQAKLRLVKSGRTFGQEIEILSGLQDGEVVVSDIGARLLDGQPVEVK